MQSVPVTWIVDGAGRLQRPTAGAAAMDGATLYFSGELEPGVPVECVGRLCVVRTQGNKQMQIAVVTQGYKSGGNLICAQRLGRREKEHPMPCWKGARRWNGCGCRQISVRKSLIIQCSILLQVGKTYVETGKCMNCKEKSTSLGISI